MNVYVLAKQEINFSSAGIFFQLQILLGSGYCIGPRNICTNNETASFQDHTQFKLKHSSKLQASALKCTVHCVVFYKLYEGNSTESL